MEFKSQGSAVGIPLHAIHEMGISQGQCLPKDRNSGSATPGDGPHEFHQERPLLVV